MSRTRRLLRLPFVLAASIAVFVLCATALTCASLLYALWFAYATCRNALATERTNGYIRGGIADLEYHLAKETKQ